MKKLIALLLALCLLLVFCAGAAGAEAAETNEELTPHQVRYYFEHRLLPNEFHNNTAELVAFLRENGLFALWRNFTQNNGFDVIYTADDFSVTEFPQEDGTFLMLLIMPKPEDTPLCARIYLCQRAGSGDTGFFTVEYDNYFGESWFLCGWTKDGNHQNYGAAIALPAPDDPGYEEALNNEINMILQLLP